MAKKVVIIGSNGQLGNDLKRVFSDKNENNIFPLTHSDIEISNPESIESALNNINPDIIINTAAYNNVDEIEKDAEKAFLINSLANKYLAKYCNKKDSIFVGISTDYVFGRDEKRNTPYTESDCPGPINVYGVSKLAAEYFIEYECKKHFIIRTCGLFGIKNSSVKKTNFVETILKASKEKDVIQVVNDQFVSPTYTYDLAKQICKLIETDAFGIYHATAQGSCSWYEFAKEIFYLTNTTINLEAVLSSNFPRPAKRPHYSVLQNKKLKELKIDIMRTWEVSLKDYLAEKRYI